MAADAPCVRFRVLGPLEVETDGRVLELSWPRLRVLVALLVANAGRVVSVAAMVESLWGDHTPPDAHRTVRTYISRLRHALRTDVIVTRSPGYLLQLEPDALDAVHFERAAAEGRAALADGQHRIAAERLTAALALWRGAAYHEFDQVVALRAEGARLDQLRLTVVEDRIDADLAAGLGGTLIAELEDLAGRHPGHERLWGQLMRALYRAGRQTEALAAFRRARDALVDAAGVEPSPALTEIHQQILAHDPRLLPAAREHPAQLPSTARGFTGRVDELATLDALLAEPQPTAAVLCAVSGAAGVGKTTLVVHWAHRVAGRFPNGHLYLNLRGFDPHLPPVPPAEAIRVLLDAFAVPPDRVPTALDAQINRYRSLLSGKRMLIVLDNAATPDQVRPLLPGASGCVTVITSRNQLTGLVTADGATPLVLDRIPADQARALLTARLGRQRVAAEPDAVDTIVARCAGLPLALAIVAARLATHPRLTFATIAAELHADRERLDALDTGDPASSIRALFTVSYQRLDPDTARLFRLLGLHPGPHVTVAAAASLAAVPIARARVLLADLTRAHLLEDQLPGRYGLHDLLRVYAEELAHHHDTDGERLAATHRLLDHCLHTARAAAAVCDPANALAPFTTPPDSVVVEEFADLRAATAWLVAEHATLVAAIRYAEAAGLDTYAVRLAWTIAIFLGVHGYHHQLAIVQRAALGAAQRLGDHAAQARAHHMLGIAEFRMGRFDQALDHHRQALDLHTPDDLVGRADIHHSIGFALHQQGDYQRALEHAERALDLYRRAGHAKQAQELGFVGVYNAMLGNNDRALECANSSLAMHETVNDPYGTAAGLWCLGQAHHNLGRYDESITAYRRLVAVQIEYGGPHFRAEALLLLGDVYADAGDPGNAREVWHDALAIFAELGHPNADKIRAKLDRATADTRPPLPDSATVS